MDVLTYNQRILQLNLNDIMLIYKELPNAKN